VGCRSQKWASGRLVPKDALGLGKTGAEQDEFVGGRESKLSGHRFGGVAAGAGSEGRVRALWRGYFRPVSAFQGQFGPVQAKTQ